MLTQFGEKGLVRKCLEIGVEGYLLKDCGKEELVKAIHAVYEGGSWFNFNHNPQQEIYSANLNLPRLTVHEKQVLKLLAEEYCNTDIAREMNIEVNTVKTYKERLKQKAGVRKTIGLIKWAIENNLL
jgi:DNA-binding NarL/FixJ family response regulator